MDRRLNVGCMTVISLDATSTGLTGHMLIAGELVRGNGTEIRGFDPVAQAPLEPGPFSW